jgi:hypothetical protein
VKGGQEGGVVGGDPNGVVVGGTGERPLLVGGNVKAPIAVKRVDPVYTHGIGDEDRWKTYIPNSAS